MLPADLKYEFWSDGVCLSEHLDGTGCLFAALRTYLQSRVAWANIRSPNPDPCCNPRWCGLSVQLRVQTRGLKLEWLKLETTSRHLRCDNVIRVLGMQHICNSNTIERFV